MIDRLADHAPPPLLYSASVVAALTQWQEDVEWGLRIFATLCAIVFSFLGYLVTRRRDRRASGKKSVEAK